MARRAHGYPQVEPGADGIANVTVASLPARARVREALALARRRDCAALVSRRGAVVLREDLARAATLGLDALPAEALSRRVPTVAASASEISVRRLLGAGAPLVLVRSARGITTAVSAGPSAAALPTRAAHGLPEATRSLLGIVAELAGTQRARAAVVGGAVRDLLLGGTLAPGDLDVVIEGDGPRLARELGARLGGRVTEHDRFLTASVTDTAYGGIDVATARFERYEAPGALPRVMPATVAVDLRRRDFTVNALALDLPDLHLLDPLDGRGDLAHRRLRILHPLSFVEDPTRIFRAARYAARLDFAEDPWTVRCRDLGLRLAPYPALSGQRIAAELGLIAGEPQGGRALTRLTESGALRLLDPGYRPTRRTTAWLGALADTLTWTRRHDLPVAPLELALVALLADQAPAVAAAALRRLALVGEPLARVQDTLGGWPALARAAGARTPSGRAAALRHRPALEVAWLRLAGTPATRRIVDWFVADARGARPALGGDDVVGLGVPRGPAVARVLGELRDGRLDTALADRAAEIEYVRQWVSRQGGAGGRPAARTEKEG